MKNKNGTTENLIEYYPHTQQMSYCYTANSYGDSYEHTYDEDGRELTYKYSIGGTTSEILKPTKPTKQSSVEWFMEKVGEKQPNGFYVIDTLQDVKNVFEQAKAMHKEEIIEAHINGQAEFDSGARRLKNDELAEKYCNEKYKTK